MSNRQWLSEDADMFLRSDEGGRALFWYSGDDALLMIEDPARAGVEIELTNPEDARGVAMKLAALACRRGRIRRPCPSRVGE